MVDGVGFEPFIDVLNSLNINWVVRTDNDIIKVPYKDYYYFSGISRCLNIYENHCAKDDEIDDLIKHKKTLLTGINSRENLTEAEEAVGQEFKEGLETYDIYLSEIDLENDILNSQLRSLVEKYYGDTNYDSLLKRMQTNKATFMYDFLYKNQGELIVLENEALSLPLKRCKEIVEELFNDTDTRTETDN